MATNNFTPAPQSPGDSLSKTSHLALHFVIAGLSFAAQYGGIIPGKYAPIGLAVQALAQSILAITINHPKQ